MSVRAIGYCVIHAPNRFMQWTAFVNVSSWKKQLASPPAVSPARHFCLPAQDDGRVRRSCPRNMTSFLLGWHSWSVTTFLTSQYIV